MFKNCFQITKLLDINKLYQIFVKLTLAIQAKPNLINQFHLTITFIALQDKTHQQRKERKKGKKKERKKEKKKERNYEGKKEAGRYINQRLICLAYLK